MQRHSAPSQFSPACPLVVSALGAVFDVARLRAGAADNILKSYVMLFRSRAGRVASCRLRHGDAARPQLDPHGDLFGHPFSNLPSLPNGFPRLGLIRIETRQFLVKAYEQMRLRIRMSDSVTTLRQLKAQGRSFNRRSQGHHGMAGQDVSTTFPFTPSYTRDSDQLRSPVPPRKVAESVVNMF